MQLRLLTKPKFLVPLLLLLWLGVSLPLSVISYAAAVSDLVCGSTANDNSGWARGVWGMPGIDRYFTGTKTHLSLVDSNNACYQVNTLDSTGKPTSAATLVYGEWWKDYPNDSYGCKTTDQQTAYNSCSDEDKNWYLKLNSSERRAAGVTNGEIKNLQRWSQCRAGQTDSTKWCNFLTETIPLGGNYGFWWDTQANPGSSDPSKDWDPTNDQPQLPDPCLDNDYNPSTVENNPCKGKNIPISFTGARVKDNNHGWKEIHPVRKEVWTDSSGTLRCYSVDYTAQANPTNPC